MRCRPQERSEQGDRGDTGSRHAGSDVAPIVGGQASLGARGEMAELRRLHEVVHRPDEGQSPLLARGAGHLRPHREAGGGGIEGIEHESPGHVPVGGRPRRIEGELGARLGVEEAAEHEVTRRLHRQHLEAVGTLRGGRNDVAHRQLHELRVQLPCAPLPAIVEDVVAVVAGAPATHLQQPWPDGIGVAAMVIPWVACASTSSSSSSPTSGPRRSASSGEPKRSASVPSTLRRMKCDPMPMTRK